MQIETRHLVTLLTLQECGSLTEAASKLNLTPSALSHQMSALEEQLGVSLFERKTKPLKLTAAGMILVPTARDVISKLDHAKNAIEALKTGEMGRLYIAIECHACFEWLMPTMTAYRKAQPDILLDLSHGINIDAIDRLKAKEIDLVITSDPVKDEQLDYIALCDYEVMLAMNPAHSLASKNYIEPQDLTGETLITYPVDTEKLDIFRQFLVPSNVKVASRRTTEMTMMMISMTSSGLGVTALPKWAVKDYVQKEFVVAKSLGKEGVWSTLYLAIRKEDGPKAYMREFIEYVRNIGMKYL